jgi:hypothetical protein
MIQMSFIKITIQKHLALILFMLSLSISVFVYDDYGVCWDEFQQHKIGVTNYDFIKGHNKDLLRFKDRDYGCAFEVGLFYLEFKLGLKEPHDIYLMRHFFTHLFYLIGCVFFFLLVNLLYNNKWLALFGYLFLYLNPLFFAHSFFNSKDIPFAMMFVICLYLAALAFKSNRWVHFVLLGIGTGLLMNLRIMGVLIVVGVVIFTILDLVFNRKDKRLILQSLLNLVAFLIIASLTLYFTWPFLWGNPIDNFGLAFQNMSKFRWDSIVLFYGKIISTLELPWYYAPAWFSITNPLLYLIVGLAGLVLVLVQFFGKPLSFLENSLMRNNLLYLLCFAGPLLSVIVLESVLYDSWRQLFFIYPPFILLGIYGLNFLWTHGYPKLLVSTIMVNFILISFFMINNHPFQHTFFNFLTDKSRPERLRKSFERDYWGTSFKQAFEVILKKDKRQKIRVAVGVVPGVFNHEVLPKKDKKRIQIVETREEADYFITNYRWHPEDYPEIENKKWHSFKVQNNTIITIFKLK